MKSFFVVWMLLLLCFFWFRLGLFFVKQGDVFLRMDIFLHQRFVGFFVHLFDKPEGLHESQVQSMTYICIYIVASQDKMLFFQEV